MKVEKYNLNKTENTETFKAYELSPEILQALKILHYEEPTDIQKKVMPIALAGKDFAARSKTGSGKTAAFAIPICQKVKWDENLPQALVLEPTRELTVQVKEEIFHIGRNKRLKVPDIFGGFPIDKQILTLKQKSHIVVGTPGRLLDHVRRGTINLSQVNTLVIDEADLMLDMGFLGDVELIMKELPKCQMMLFSATLNDSLQDLMDRYMDHPEMIAIDEDGETVAVIRQTLIEIDASNEEEQAELKYEALLNTLINENPDSCIIFCGTKEMANVLCRKLGRSDVKCGVLHGDIDQQDRLRTIDGFRLGRFRYLIATDVAARGIDFPSLSLVFNYDFPTGRETYIHRIGRTGRNGQPGRAVTLMTNQEKKYLRVLEEYLQYEIPKKMTPRVTTEQRDIFKKRQKEKAQLKERKGADFKQSITRLTISGGKKSKMRPVDIVGTICSIDGISAEDIGVIDIRDSISYVDIMNQKGKKVYDALQNKTIKGKLRKVKITRNLK